MNFCSQKILVTKNTDGKRGQKRRKKKLLAIKRYETNDGAYVRF